MPAVDVPVLLGALGIRAEHKGTKWVARCPSPEHNDSSPSWSIIDKPGDRRHGSHHCFSCKWGGGPWELAGAIWKMPAEEAGKRLREMGIGAAPPMPKTIPKVVVTTTGYVPPRAFKLPIGVEIPGPDGRWFGPALAYLLERGVTREQIDRWGFGYAVRGKLRFRVVAPVYDATGRLLSYSARAFSSAATGDRYDTGRVRDGAFPRRAIWGEAGFAGDACVTVAEGVFSALALERAGAPNPCALLGSELTEDKARVLSRFRTIIVASDPDKAGDAIADRLSVLGRRARLVRMDAAACPSGPCPKCKRTGVASPDDAEPDDLRAKIDRALSILC